MHSITENKGKVTFHVNYHGRGMHCGREILWLNFLKDKTSTLITAALPRECEKTVQLEIEKMGRHFQKTKECFSCSTETAKPISIRIQAFPATRGKDSSFFPIPCTNEPIFKAGAFYTILIEQKDDSLQATFHMEVHFKDILAEFGQVCEETSAQMGTASKEKILSAVLETLLPQWIQKFTPDELSRLAKEGTREEYFSSLNLERFRTAFVVNFLRMYSKQSMLERIESQEKKIGSIIEALKFIADFCIDKSLRKETGNGLSAVPEEKESAKKHFKNACDEFDQVHERISSCLRKDITAEKILMSVLQNLEPQWLHNFTSDDWNRLMYKSLESGYLFAALIAEYYLQKSKIEPVIEALRKEDVEGAFYRADILEDVEIKDDVHLVIAKSCITLGMMREAKKALIKVPPEVEGREEIATQVSTKHFEIVFDDLKDHLLTHLYESSITEKSRVKERVSNAVEVMESIWLDSYSAADFAQMATEGLIYPPEDPVDGYYIKALIDHLNKLSIKKGHMEQLGPINEALENMQFKKALQLANTFEGDRKHFALLTIAKKRLLFNQLEKAKIILSQVPEGTPGKEDLLKIFRMREFSLEVEQSEKDLTPPQPQEEQTCYVS